MLTKKMQIYKILQFPLKSFLILKLLYDNLIIKDASYIFFKKKLFQKTFGFLFFVFEGLIYC